MKSKKKAPAAKKMSMDKVGGMQKLKFPAPPKKMSTTPSKAKKMSTTPSKKMSSK